LLSRDRRGDFRAVVDEEEVTGVGLMADYFPPEPTEMSARGDGMSAGTGETSAEAGHLTPAGLPFDQLYAPRCWTGGLSFLEPFAGLARPLQPKS
jgi:hypothetical protein